MTSIENIKWIFFDVGGVLTDETEYNKQRVEAIVGVVNKFGGDISPADVWQVWPETSAIQGNLNDNFIKAFLGNRPDVEEAVELIRETKPDYTKWQKIRPEAKEVVSKLAENYNLSIIANQHSDMKVKLEEAGILQYFTEPRMSEDLNLLKPDKRIFETVMSSVGAEASLSAMIDDNIERSLVPAKELGMTTVWMKVWERKTVPEGLVDYKIKDLRKLIAIFG